MRCQPVDLLAATKFIKPLLTDVPGAVDIIIDILAADGSLISSNPCTTSACSVLTDDRQTYMYNIRYRNGSGSIIASSGDQPVKIQ